MIDVKTSTIVNDVITPHYVCGATGQPVNLDHGERFAITKLVKGDYKHVHRKNGDVKCVKCWSSENEAVDSAYTLAVASIANYLGDTK